MAKAITQVLHQKEQDDSWSPMNSQSDLQSFSLALEFIM